METILYYVVWFVLYFGACIAMATLIFLIMLAARIICKTILGDE